ncbi:hypothetical protein LEMLEM_LOCUS2460 [Lemmus lemmus]
MTTDPSGIPRGLSIWHLISPWSGVWVATGCLGPSTPTHLHPTFTTGNIFESLM